MATSKQVCRALNAANKQNIFDENLLEMLEDYFNFEEEEEGSEDEEKEEFLDNDVLEDAMEEDGMDQQGNDKEKDEDEQVLFEPTILRELDFVTEDVEEERRKAEIFSCCKMVVGGQKTGCKSQFTVDQIMESRLSFASNSYEEQNAILCGIVAATKCNKTDHTQRSRHGMQTLRQRKRTFYFLENKSVCRAMLLFLLGISSKRLHRVAEACQTSLFGPVQDGRGGRNKTAMTVGEVEDIVVFLNNLVEESGMALPGRIPGFKRDDVLVLPTSNTKTGIHQQYVRATESAGKRAVARTAFMRIWTQYCPNIIVGKPKTDLCWTCQRNNIFIMRSANADEEDKEERLLAQQEHLHVVREERQYYNALLKEAKMLLGQPNPSIVHYSFDYAQQVHLPHNPLQPGPVYFLTPRKIQIFGVCCEAIPRQINYLIDEGMTLCKGSNTVISLLHHHLFNYHQAGRNIVFHCDNCTGQNKNQFVISYFAWLCMKGHFDSIGLHFMPAGHTKFSPDWCFGLLKRRFRKCEVNSLEEMCEVVKTSTQQHINQPHVVGWEDGTVNVPLFDWKNFFNSFKAVKHIKSYFHFRFTSRAPGKVFVKSNLNGEEEEVLVSTSTPEGERPDVIPPAGIPPQRRKYLHDQIRPFVSNEWQDILCPAP